MNAKRYAQMLMFDLDADADQIAASVQHEQPPPPPAETAALPPILAETCTGVLFCSRCGTPSGQASDQEFCPRCGTRRCVSCGDL